MYNSYINFICIGSCYTSASTCITATRTNKINTSKVCMNFQFIHMLRAIFERVRRRILEKLKKHLYSLRNKHVQLPEDIF